MSAANVVMEARAAGIQLHVEGDDLLLEAAAPPSPAVLGLLSRHKPAIVLWLRPGADGWSAEDWQAHFDERARIREYDGGMSREEAESLAFEDCVFEWLNRHPEPTDPGHCAWCGLSEGDGCAVVPFGTRPRTHTWVHHQCWADWFERRRQLATETLTRMGIRPGAQPSGKSD